MTKYNVLSHKETNITVNVDNIDNPTGHVENNASINQ